MLLSLKQDSWFIESSADNFPSCSIRSSRSRLHVHPIAQSRPYCCVCRFLAGNGEGADRRRSSMFKLVPSIEQGSWIIKQSVGNTPVLLGKKLKTEYHRRATPPRRIPKQQHSCVRW